MNPTNDSFLRLLSNICLKLSRFSTNESKWVNPNDSALSKAAFKSSSLTPEGPNTDSAYFKNSCASSNSKVSPSVPLTKCQTVFITSLNCFLLFKKWTTEALS
jgi:hypothetical protein